MLINLLPHREWARQRQKQRFIRELGAAVLLGGLVCGAVWAVQQRAIEQQQARNHFLAQAIAQLDLEIRQAVALDKETAALRTRRLNLERLQADRHLPVHLLQELVLQLPDGVALSSLKQDRQEVVLTGVAQSQQRVSELLHNLDSSDWLSRPELVEIVASPAHSLAASVGPPADARAAARFTVRVKLSPAAAVEDPPALSRGG